MAKHAERLARNPKLKKTNVKINFTKDQVEEYVRCLNDPLYFIKNYIYIVHPDHGKMLFKMWPFQEKMASTFIDNRFVICKLPRQSGKVLPRQTAIPTPSGFKKMEDLKVGDQVFGDDGKPCNVVHVSELQNVEMYKITFDDGNEVICCEDHQWTVYDRLNQKRTVVDGKWIHTHRKLTKTIKDLYNSHWKRTNKRGYEEYAYYIPNTKPVEYQHKNTKIDPYILGLWLGDGTNRNTDLTCHINHVPFYESQGVKFGKDRINKEKRPNLFTAKMLNFEISDLQYYNIQQTETGVKTKRIPTDYLFNDVQTRINLVQGLMDTDGFVEKTGECCIQLTNKNLSLIEDIYTLLCSLGLKVTKRFYESTFSTRLSFTVARDQFDVCRIPHKLERQKQTLKCARYVYSRTIQNIEPLNKKDIGLCIQVDSPEHLYLCTPSYIPTHNTTTTAAIILWYILFNKNFRVAVLAHKLKQSKQIIERIQLAYENLPDWLQQGVKDWNKETVSLENGSSIIASSTSSSAIRGEALNLIFLDEFGFVPLHFQQEFYTSAYPTISSGSTTKIIITSTPNGMNLFYKLWKEAGGEKKEEKKNTFVPLHIHWSDVPGRDEKWREEQIGNIGEEKFRQEFETEFIGSSSTLIDGAFLMRMTSDAPIASNEDIAIYEHPQENRTYIGSVDVARGINRDYSAFTIVDTTEIPYKVVFRYKNNNVPSMIFPTIIHQALKHYNNAYALIETNDIGHTIATDLHYNLEYENIFMTKRSGKLGQILTFGFGTENSEFGVRNSITVKRIGCMHFKTMVEKSKLIIPDQEILNELYSFVQDGQTYNAEEGAHDDLVTTLVLFSWLVHQEQFKEWTNTNMRYRLLKDSEVQLQENLIPFGLINDHNPIYTMFGEVPVMDVSSAEFDQILRTDEINFMIEPDPVSKGDKYEDLVNSLSWRK